MKILPTSRIGHSLLFIWLIACLATLVFAFVQREIHDASIVFAYLMIFLTFPLGYALAAFVGAISFGLYSTMGIVMPDGFIPNLVWWVMFVAVGYLQWFVLVPWLFRKLHRSSDPVAERNSAQTAGNKRMF